MFVTVASEDCVILRDNWVGCMRVVEFGFTTNYDIWVVIGDKEVQFCNFCSAFEAVEIKLQYM